METVSVQNVPIPNVRPERNEGKGKMQLFRGRTKCICINLHEQRHPSPYFFVTSIMQPCWLLRV